MQGAVSGKSNVGCCKGWLNKWHPILTVCLARAAGCGRQTVKRGASQALKSIEVKSWQRYDGDGDYTDFTQVQWKDSGVEIRFGAADTYTSPKRDQDRKRVVGEVLAWLQQVGVSV
jgi:hypothetical protein